MVNYLKLLQSSMVISLLFFSACTTVDTEPFTFQYTGDQLVVYAWINPQGAKAFVGLSQSLNNGVVNSETQQDTIADATVHLLTEAGDTINKLEYIGAGNYQLNSSLIEGATYVLTVKKTNFPVVKSMPVRIPKLTFSSNLSPVIDGADPETWEATLSLNDALYQNDVYIIGGYNPAKDSLPFTPLDLLRETFTDNFFHTNTWIDLEPGYGQQCSLYAWGMLDDCFRDASITLPIIIDYYGGGAVEGQEYYFEITSVSPEYYEYAKSLLSSEIIIEYIFDSPSIEVTNLEGGLGFVAAKNSILLPIRR